MIFDGMDNETLNKLFGKERYRWRSIGRWGEDKIEVQETTDGGKTWRDLSEVEIQELIDKQKSKGVK